MTKTMGQRVLSIFLCLVLMVSYLPLTAAAAPMTLTAVEGIITDPNTSSDWEHMMGTATDGNRYAGRVWADRSVYKDGETVTLNSRNEAGSSFTVNLEDDEAFQVVFSVLGSTMATEETISSSGPMDVVLIMDTSTSMDDEDSQGVTRLERTINAANTLLSDLVTLPDARIAIVTYNNDSETVLPLATYENGIVLEVTNYYYNNSRDSGVVTAYDKSTPRKQLGKDSGYTQGTNLQAGIDRGFNILANATDAKGRTPIAIVLTDGQANRANRTSFYNITSSSSASGDNLYLSTLLNAAYNKTKVEEHYGANSTVYGIGVDLGTNTTARLLMNPAHASYGFNDTNYTARSAYQDFLDWAEGETVTGGNMNSRWTFDHNYPNMNGAITDAKIAANIHYVDTYYDVTNTELENAFQQIYDELSSGAFNPISSSSSVQGGTGVDDTPLIYVDFIGQYMEIKEIQSITLFGESVGVVRGADGSYTVNSVSGVNPTTQERWNTAEDIRIAVTTVDGYQKLEIRINQEILPIIMEKVLSETVGNVTTSTITELLQEPMRVYYTIGIDDAILLPNGKVDVSKIQGYDSIDDVNGTVSFYSSRYGVENTADASGVVLKGDAHVGFKPSLENRYYYHQTNQGIFTEITDKNGNPVTIPESNEYGIRWDESKYDLSWMTYEEYTAVNDTDKVYTYVTYYHPTPALTDAADAAEEVTYLVYTEWKYLKESVAFYDNNAKAYLNDGKAIPADEVDAVIREYLRNNPDAELYAVLGVGSRRTSRLHNMMVNKTENTTQTAVESYTPEYLEQKAQHNDNDVVIWLGNNGRQTVEIETGIALTKAVTEAIGDANDTYALTVTVPTGIVAEPTVVDAQGNVVASTYVGNVLTVGVKAGETVYISGIPGGTACAIGEVVNGDYYIESKTDTVVVPLVSQALSGAAQFVPAVVTNAPYEYANLFITKEIVSNHAVPESVMNTAFTIKVDLGAALAGKTFDVLDSAHANAYQVTADANGALTFSIKARQTVEILRLPAGTTATVTEQAPGSHFAVSYRTRNHSGETADTDNTVVIPTDGNATAVVFNTYTPSPVSVDLDVNGTKHFEIEGTHTGGTFNYTVQKWNGTAWEDISGKTASTPYAANESGVKTFVIDDVLAGITYTEVGNHAYRVLEVKGNVSNVTYDRTVYTFDVTVTDNGGQLVATVVDRNNTPITDGSYEVTFHNTHHAAPVSLDINKVVVNKSGDADISEAGFEFKAVQTDASWTALSGAAASEGTVFSDAAGKARFAATYKAAGTYYYVLSEVDKGANGWTYSDAEYRITVTVTENNGDLTAALTIVKVNSVNAEETASVDAANAAGEVTFVNTYDPTDSTVNLDGAVAKVLTGKTLEADEFTFYVYASDDRTTPILTGTNGLNGNVDFDKALTFDRVGKYEYDIVESIPAAAVLNAATGKYELNGMTYDPTIYDLVVEITNDAAGGKLVVEYYFEDEVSNVVTFRNSYRATPTSYTLSGVKILNGRAPRGGEFEFELYEGDVLKETVTNKADGSFAFTGITYTAAGTYTYTVKEKVGNVAGVRYDGATKPVTVTVTVTDTNGVLSAAATGEIKFENTYTAAPARVTFNGSKTVAGSVAADNAFTFNLYATDNTFDITKESAALVASAKNVGGVFAFTKEFSATGTYYFVIAESSDEPIDGIVYDRTKHTFSVHVRDIGDGQLKAAVTNVSTGVTAQAVAEVTADVAFVNATFEEVVEKEVYYAGAMLTQIDGKRVEAGDVLTYFISYTNYTGEDVVVDIMDTIPNFTTYVEGTASHGGTYAGEHIHWALNVEKGGSVTVSFDVTVDQTDAIVANTAVLRDGVNTYSTNEVVNHTVENELKKDVFYPTDVTVSIDGKTVKAGEELVYTISFTNASATATDVTITDTIPELTTYVDGSADSGGVYEDGEIVWALKDVPAWSTVTVAFKVVVDEAEGVIRNTAFALQSENTHISNEVSNPIEAPTPEIPTPPQTGENTNLWFLFALMFVSGGVFTLAVREKKR